jgi:hypothetical protein
LLVIFLLLWLLIWYNFDVVGDVFEEDEQRQRAAVGDGLRATESAAMAADDVLLLRA